MSTGSSEDHVFEALRAPGNAVAVELAAALHRARPDRFITFTDIYAFDVAEFARHQQAVLTPRVSSLVSWGRTESGKLVCPVPKTGWFDVEWNGQHLEVVAATFGAAGEIPETYWSSAAMKRR